MPLIIEKKKIKEWLMELKKNFKVVNVKNSILPPKKYFFPPQEDIFVFDKKTKNLNSVDYKKQLLVFGLSLNKLEGIKQLDEIMSKPELDFFYWQRREKSVLVGLTDDSVEVISVGDLILEKINQKQYQVLVLTDKGKKLAQSKFFKEIKNPEIKKYPQEENPFKKMLLDSEVLAEAVEWSWKVNYKIWDELAKKCLGCGICTYVCPLCHCFSMKDRVSLDDKKCVRCRQWDACTLPSFAKVAGGHNFHKTIKERYYNWFYHKFVRSYREYGKPQCIACGHCKKYCPAGIKIGEVLEEIVKEYKKVKI
ncbi:4Fe-4S dicluster domain-containing protein [Patescibacteria group bacterium]|nr:4Fe-4S dicluster domain-containing protein [Patescibacteria group bacterium]